MEEEKEFHVEYFIIPYKIMIDRELVAIDRYIYATIYWLSRLRNKKCTASNKRIGRCTGNVKERTVERSLVRLEKRKYIKRYYFDKKKKHRKEIKPLIFDRRHKPEEELPD